MKTPGPDHPITVTPAGQRWRAKFNDHVIADSADALILQEARYPPVVYFPRADVSMEFLASTTHSTHCPYKGDAGYFSLRMDGQLAENAVWTYDTPFPAMSAIAQHVAFYPDKVEIYALDEAVSPALQSDVDQVVLHTDSGSGQSQREPWPANVNTPTDGGVR